VGIKVNRQGFDEPTGQNIYQAKSDQAWRRNDQGNLIMEIFSFSGKGLREKNEDYLLSRQLSADCSIHLLADGMGGYQYGEIASSLACHAIADYLEKNLTLADVEELIRNSISFANDQIRDEQTVLRGKMGTTIAGALIKGKDAWVFWLGDVRIYHIRENQVLFQSEDHSLINEIRKESVLSAKDIARYGNIVTKSISGNILSEELPVVHLELESNDNLILCTDGLWRIIDVLTIPDRPGETLHEYFSEMGERIGDNYSVVLIGAN
jgi:serine/threonine protein phosphatase PrpC